MEIDNGHVRVHIIGEKCRNHCSDDDRCTHDDAQHVPPGEAFFSKKTDVTDRKKDGHDDRDREDEPCQGGCRVKDLLQPRDKCLLPGGEE